MTSLALDELEFSLPGLITVDMKNPMWTDFSLKSGNIGTDELETLSSPEIQQKWRFE
jgi:hypothetical protein